MASANESAMAYLILPFRQLNMVLRHRKQRVVDHKRYRTLTRDVYEGVLSTVQTCVTLGLIYSVLDNELDRSFLGLTNLN